VKRFLGTPFGVAVLGCLLLAGWAMWSGGVVDSPIARHVRSSSVYAAPGVEVDRAAAERVIGNRRLVVLLLEPGADQRQACRDVEHAADGTLVLVLSPAGDEYDTFGCALVPGRDDENFGRAAVAETVIGRGTDQFADRPVEALKVVVVNYDLLVKAGTLPDGARTISPSLPRYLVALAAVGAVIAGSASVYAAARRAGRLAVARRSRRDAATDARSALSAETAVLAQQIIDLDRRHATARTWQAEDRQAFDGRFRDLMADYAKLLEAITTADNRGDVDPSALATRVRLLSERCDRLARG
jgi:hypothetical protein